MKIRICILLLPRDLEYPNSDHQIFSYQNFFEVYRKSIFINNRTQYKRNTKLFRKASIFCLKLCAEKKIWLIDGWALADFCFKLKTFIKEILIKNPFIIINWIVIPHFQKLLINMLFSFTVFIQNYSWLYSLSY